jgi:NADP-dependent 3-hydroxy acid dehydrogenase YdfG
MKKTSQVMKEYRKIAISPDAIALPILFAIEQPADVDLDEIIVTPTVAN